MTSRRRLSVGAAAVGLAVFAAGLAAALAWLPSWRTGPVPDRPFFVGRYAALLRAAGLEPAGGLPIARLVSRGRTFKTQELEPVIDAYPGNASRWLAAHGRGIEVDVSQSVAWRGGAAGRLTVRFDLAGRPWAIRKEPDTLSGTVSGPRLTDADLSRLLALFVEPGRRLGPPTEKELFTESIAFYPLLGGNGPETLVVLRGFGDLRVSRHLGDVDWVWARLQGIRLKPILVAASLRVAGLIAVVILVLVLLARRRLGAANGALLAGAVLAGSLLGWVLPIGNPVAAVDDGIRAVGASMFVFMLWCGAESWIRSTIPGFTTSLDRLRAGVLGPREGSALLSGFGYGAAAAGLQLAIFAAGSRLVTAVPPATEGVSLPFFHPTTGSFADPPVLAGLVLLAIAASVRFLPARWAGAGALVLAAAALAVREDWLRPYAVTFAAIAPPAVLFVSAYRRSGLAALLAAALSSVALPAAVLSGLHAAWLPGTLAVSAALALGIPAAGLVGLARPESQADERLLVPKFVRRLEEERRVRYEMDLLSRMQVGLLPERPPVVPGYEIAARSLLANEAGGDLYDFLFDERGRLWIAAGDVSGHGYSCAIAQAMTKAALASLVDARKLPSEILSGVDRVLRGSGAVRTFTTLALVRLDPESGRCSLANAGHPYAYLRASGQVSEIPAPGLPLGQGPARDYRDESFELPGGGVLVLASDGLMEALDKTGAGYGFDRPREVLGAAGGGAQEILEALIGDWRRHLAGAPALDDTTIVVVKRLG
jgi:serine phosphatase RsbU (regulator of sigma subunit)